VYAAESRALADAADAARKALLPLGPLHGLPIGLKDLCDIAGRIGTVGSKMWAARVAESTSATVERLLAAGMIPLGKLHMVEFAFGAWGTNPLMGTPWNPWDLKRSRVPGGSSSGTGVAVAAGLVPAGIGSDTGGSVRIPSAFNGLVGLKTTFGRISLHGTALLSWTLDTIGPLARSVDDCAALLRVLAQPPLDLPAELVAGRPHHWRIALPDRAQLPPFMHPAVLAAWTDAAQRLEKLGAQIVPVRLPEWYFDLGRQVGMIIASEAYELHRAHIEDRGQAINDAVRERILGAAKLAPGEYAGMLRTMAERRRAFGEWFRDFDALLLPTVALPAPALDEIEEQAPIPAYLTRAVNYLGLSALAMPAGRTARAGAARTRGGSPCRAASARRSVRPAARAAPGSAHADPARAQGLYRATAEVRRVRGESVVPELAGPMRRHTLLVACRTCDVRHATCDTKGAARRGTPKPGPLHLP